MERYNSDFDHVGDFVERWNAGVRHARVWTVAIGALLVVAGIASAAAPMSIYAFIQGLVAAALVVGGLLRSRPTRTPPSSSAARRCW